MIYYSGSTPPPGHFIKEELAARDWTQSDLAYILGCPVQAVNMIISGKRGISPEMAKALGHAFDVPGEFFANLQKAFDLSQARDPDPAVSRRARLQSAFPIREMIKRGWLHETDAAMLEAQMMRFFEVNRLEDISQIPHAAKKTTGGQYQDAEPAQLAWLYRVRQIAKQMNVPRYSEKALRTTCGRLKYLLVDPEEARHVPKLLADCGVRLMLVEPLPNSKIDGVCTWIDDGPVIALSFRLDRIDNFWFVLRHECEHALREDGKTSSVRIDEDIGASFAKNAEDLPEEEKLANEAAADFCVPNRAMNDFIIRKSPFFSERDIIGFSRIQERHPGLVIGQLHWKAGRYDLLRKYLIKMKSFVGPYCMVDGWGQIAPVSL
jgi:HTH-type transcriptional regulator/antitoxin HigA